MSVEGQCKTAWMISYQLLCWLEGGPGQWQWSGAAFGPRSWGWRPEMDTYLLPCLHSAWNAVYSIFTFTLLHNTMNSFLVSSGQGSWRLKQLAQDPATKVRLTESGSAQTPIARSESRSPFRKKLTVITRWCFWSSTMSSTMLLKMRKVPLC